ncbi:MAG: methyltransferase domain-containing protein [Candidatus Eremiobacteraeota bacterium]|nr:methyltransferase domain-containing protein [Candidatus Eremiobacteraeota bacterium]
MADVGALRQALVEHLKQEGSIRTAAVERVFVSVPRHVFVPQASVEEAYADRVVRIKEQNGNLLSSCSQPAIIAEMLEQLAVSAGNRILEIGTGSGYTAALLAALTGPHGSVTTIDIEADLVGAAREHLDTAGFTAVKTLVGDGALGDCESAPFDRILLTASSTDIAAAWWEQLASDGRLVMPLSLKGVQKSVAFARRDATLISETMIDCGFILLRGMDQSSDHIYTLSREPPVFLAADHTVEVDRPALAQRLLSERPIETTVPITVNPRELLASLATWLGFKEPCSCKLETHGEDLLHLPTITRRSFDYRLSVGLCARDTVVLLHLDNKLRVYRFGPRESLAQRLADRLLEWDRLGRPGSANVRIVAMPRSNRDPATLALADEILERPHTTFCLMRRDSATN